MLKHFVEYYRLKPIVMFYKLYSLVSKCELTQKFKHVVFIKAYDLLIQILMEFESRYNIPPCIRLSTTLALCI